MRNNKAIFVFVCVIFLSSFKSSEIAINDFIYCEIRCCFGNPTIDYSIKFINEGLICNNPYPNETNKFSGAFFIKHEELDIDKIMKFEEFLIRNDFFLYDSIYECDNIVLDGSLKSIVLRRKDEFKVIKYFECYHPQIDSIFYFMNELIPNSSNIEKFSIPGNRYAKKNNINCISH